MPTVDEFSRWLEGYRQALIAFDAEAGGELFSVDATYQDSPYADPVVGRAAIVAYWQMAAELMTDVELECEVVAVSGHVGVAHLRDALTRVSSGTRAATMASSSSCSIATDAPSIFGSGGSRNGEVGERSFGSPRGGSGVGLESGS